MIQVLDKSFEVFIEKEEIAKEIAALASQINEDYKGQEVVFVSVLNGAFMFTSDLLKLIDLECEVSFVKMSSYQGMSTTGKVEELIGLNTKVTGKKVILIEDIVDTGITIDNIIKLVKSHNPEDVKICTLLYKPDAFKGTNAPHYVGFSIPNAFVVGFGLDYDQKGRNLDTIYQIRNEN